MPPTVVIFYAEDNFCPILDWLETLPFAARKKCRDRLSRLAALGYELRRPEADFLKDGIHELRATNSGTHYRLLYFFHQSKAVISHGLVKEREVPAKDIFLAITRRTKFAHDPRRHTHEK